MSTESQSRLIGLLQAVSAAAAWGIFAIGCLALLGWLFDIAVLKSLGPHLVSMKANSAAAFVLIGISLWFSQASRRGFRLGGYVAWCSASVVAVTGLLTLLEYGSGRSLGIDNCCSRSRPGRCRPSLRAEWRPTRPWSSCWPACRCCCWTCGRAADIGRRNT